MGKGSFYRAHCLCAHLPSPFVDSFKVSLKHIQGFRRSIHLNLLIEVRRAEAASKLENLERGEKNVRGSETSLVAKRHRFGQRQDMSFSDSLLWLLWRVSVSLSLSATEFPLWTIPMQGSEATAACSGGIFWSLMGNVVHSEALTLERGSDTEIPVGSHNGISSSVSVALDNFQCSTFH